MSDTQFQLKTTPPRPGRSAHARPRLERLWTEINDRTAIIVTAPQGFGKTTLLAHWRARWLERGALVAWASLDADDDRARFVEMLLFALRAATGHEAFETAAAQNRLQTNRELDALTSLLAEVAVLASPTVVVLDDAHRMPQATMHEVIDYLVNNAPPNLQFLIGSRRPLDLPLSDLVASGRLARVDVGNLRFELDESIEILRRRFGGRISLDDAARLHELTEGWPLGLQLAASTIERTTNLHEMIGQLDARRGEIYRFFFESMLSQRTTDEAEFVVRIAILEAINAEVAEAVTQSKGAGKYIATFARESPIATESEDRQWLRLHSLARDFLLGQFDKLPPEERRGCHERAAAWYARHGQLQEAARHAFAAGDEESAAAYASQCLLDVAREGRLTEAREWMKRLPSSSMSRDLRLRLVAAWITALGSDARTVPKLIEDIALHPQFDDDRRFEAAVIMAGAAIFCDEPDRLAAALQALESIPDSATELHAIAVVNARATLFLHRGQSNEVRRVLWPPLTSTPRDASMRLALGFADLVFGLSHVVEGQPLKAIAYLQPRLQSAERELGRRSTIAAMLAGVLAAAQFVCDLPDQAIATLADRLDVIERTGMPDSIILAYWSLAGLALLQGDEPRALQALETLYELGVRRGLPRVMLASLGEQVRLHAVRERTETAGEVLQQLDALRAVFEQPPYLIFSFMFERTRAIAAGYVHTARSDFAGAEVALRAAADAPLHGRRAPAVLVARALLAVAIHERDATTARELLLEALSLAELGGMRRYVANAHPRIEKIIAQSDLPARSSTTPGDGLETSQTSRPPLERCAPATGGLLTPKEARILGLLAVGRANKEIARAMDVGEQTVKWHLKNVYTKLNAGSRKHAVDRARLLGLLGA